MELELRVFSELSGTLVWLPTGLKQVDITINKCVLSYSSHSFVTETHWFTQWMKRVKIKHG